MEFQRPQCCLCFVLFSLLYYGSQAYVFYAGGRDGWVLNPSEEYNHWAGRNRFLVNDTIVFKYKKGSNSVLVVNKEDYDKCNKTNPIKKFEDGNSVFKIDRSGPFYFISGTGDYCEKGQKLIVWVLAIRSPPHHPPPPSSVSPSPASQPPVANQPSPAVSPSPSPHISPSSPPAPAVSPHPAPHISPSSPPAPEVSPNPSPKISPSSPSPAVSPTPASAPSPAETSPTPSPANTPAGSPTSSPSPATSTPGSSPPTPSESTPPSVPGSPATPSANPPGSANPSSSNETSPPPPNGSWDLAPSSLVVYVAIFVLSAAVSGILVGQ